MPGESGSEKSNQLLAVQFFLDEIGNLSLSMQSKLLSVFQNKEICRLGSNKSTLIDVRFICATNKDLEKMIQDNTFIKDVFTGSIQCN